MPPYLETTNTLHFTVQSILVDKKNPLNLNSIVKPQGLGVDFTFESNNNNTIPHLIFKECMVLQV